MITSVVLIGEVVEWGFRESMENWDGHVKVLVQPTSTNIVEYGKWGAILLWFVVVLGLGVHFMTI